MPRIKDPLPPFQADTIPRSLSYSVYPDIYIPIVQTLLRIFSILYPISKPTINSVGIYTISVSSLSLLREILRVEFTEACSNFSRITRG